MSATYPTISEATLTPFRALEVQFQSLPDLLDRPECPYSDTVKVYIRRLLDIESKIAGDLTDAADEALDAEIADLYRMVKRDASKYTGADPKDKMQFLRTANDLLTKLVDLQTKRFNVRNMARTLKAVTEAMEEFLTPAQRTEFISKIEAYIDV